jgi:hypothetical protein
MEFSYNSLLPLVPLRFLEQLHSSVFNEVTNIIVETDIILADFNYYYKLYSYLFIYASAKKSSFDS